MSRRRRNRTQSQGEIERTDSGKKRAVPASDSRESPLFWQRMFDASDKRRDQVMELYARGSRWIRGDLRDVVEPKDIEDNLRWQTGLGNMTHLATVASLADLLFRWPQFVVNTPYTPPPQNPELDPNTGMPLTPPAPPTLFNPAFARCQTVRLNYLLRRTGYLEKARRALQDCLTGGMGVLKITADQEVVVDEDTLEAAKQEALNELDEWMKHGVLMVAKDDQIHSVHIAIKKQFLSEAEKGGIPLPKPAIKYLRKHIDIHESMKGSERPTWTIQSNQIRVRRVCFLDYFWDPTVTERDDASWRGTRYLMRKADLLANEDFDEEARLLAGESMDRWETRPTRPQVLTPGSFDLPEGMIMCCEVFDLVEQKRRVFVEGVPLMLVNEDRGELKVLQPSGPFNELVFVEDNLEGHGVSPRAIFESEQAAISAISSANVRAAIQSAPRTMYNTRDIPADQAQRIWKANAGEFIPTTPQGDPKKPLEDCFAQVPAPEIPKQNLDVLAHCIRGIERMSGLGTSKMGGGEQAPTATGAALGAEASMSISEDRGALTDAWNERSGRMIVRLDRRFTPKADWIEVCGDEAIEAVPERISLVESADDIAVELVPGCTRRRNTSVDQKQSMDLLTGLAGLPQLQGPEGTKLVLTMARRIADDGGLPGLPWDPAMQEASMMAQMAAQAAQEGAGASEEDEEGSGSSEGSARPSGPRSTSGGSRAQETQGVAPNDIEQGTNNPGAGRVPTGASTGDKVRAYRGQALKNVTARGA